MARGRMLNKVIGVSVKFATLQDDTARLLATWTIAHLDKRGVFYGDPDTVRGYVAPMLAHLTHARVAAILDDMERVGLIERFNAGGRIWQVWPGFAHNQPYLRGEREASDFPDPAGFSRATAGLNPSIDGLNRATAGFNPAEVQVKGIEVNGIEGAPAPAAHPKRRIPGFAVVHTEHIDERVAAYMSILGQKQITETNADMIMRRVPVDCLAIWRDVLTIWAIGGDRGPYNATNFSGLFERYDAEANSRRVKSTTPAPSFQNGNGRGKPITLPQVRDPSAAERAASEDRARKQRAERAEKKAAMEVSR